MAESGSGISKDYKDSISDLIGDIIRGLVSANAAILVEALFYGIHVALFAICMRILILRRPAIQWFILFSAITMFLLSTVDIALTMRIFTYDLANILEPEGGKNLTKHITLKNPLFVANNFIAELTLLYRCYMAWNRSKYVLIFASFLILADSVWGFLGLKAALVSTENVFIPLYMWSILVINIVLTGITVGRIFWIGRIARHLGYGQLSGYHTAIAILLESSLLYSICILIALTFSRQSPYLLVVITICMRMVAIMPTLLIVQVGLGRVVQDTNNSTGATATEHVESMAVLGQQAVLARSEEKVGSASPGSNC